MKNISRTITMAIAFLWGLSSLSGTALAQHSFIEDFTSNTLKDTYNTTADWNTSQGELRLWPFESTIGNAVETPGNAARSITMHGQYAYVADGYAGIQIFNMRYPFSPSLVGTIDTPGYVYQIQIAGDFAYVADHSGDLRVLDISDPEVPVAVASLSLSQNSIGLFVAGNYAYVNVGGSVQVVDITNPLSPSVAGSYVLSTGAARNIIVSGDAAFVAAGDGGLVVLDISNPTSPLEIGSFQTQGYLWNLAIKDDHAYLTTQNSGLEIVNISNPASPFLAGTIPSSDDMRSVDIDGSRAFLANDDNGLLIVDISNPAQPVLEETVNTPGHAYDVVIEGKYAFVCDLGTGLQVVQIAQSVDMTLRGTHDGGTWGDPVSSGSHLYLPCQNDGLKILDISNPDQPLQVGTFDVNEQILGVDISGDLAVLAVASDGIMIADISDPTSPVLLAQMSTPSSATGVAISGDYAYVAATNALLVIDISVPLSPVLVGSHAGTNARSVALQGNMLLLYSSNGPGSTMEIFDITQPASPSVESIYTSSGTVYDLQIHGDLVYISGTDPQLQVVDISDPSAPFLTGGANFGSDPLFTGGIEIVGNLVYLASGNNIMIYSISNPAYPSYRDHLFTGTYYPKILLAGEMLVALGSQNGKTEIYQTFQHEVDLNNSIGQSQWIPLTEDPMDRVRLTSTTPESVQWTFYADGDYSQNVVVENTWTNLDIPGSSLYWSANLQLTPGTLSQVSELKIEWLYEHALIESITDIPNDQGRQVRLEWTRSGHDFVGDDSQIVEYAVYREIDDELVNKAASVADLDGASSSLMDNIQIMSAAGWDFLMTLPVLVEDRYAVVVPTLADSSLAGGAYSSTFKVVALTATPGVYFTSHPDSGSSVDNLAPGVPMGIMASYEADSVNLAWEEAPEEDFRYFRVYRGTNPSFIPDSDNLIQEVASPSWVDDSASPWQYHYKISAVDFSGNESLAGEVLNASSAPDAGLVFALHGAVPNPFNPSTLIKYSLAETGKVQLSIYDVAGRLVRTLVDDVLTAGEHSVRWDGRNQAGKAMASGAYFSLLRNGEMVQRQRMLLVK